MNDRALASHFLRLRRTKQNERYNVKDILYISHVISLVFIYLEFFLLSWKKFDTYKFLHCREIIYFLLKNHSFFIYLTLLFMIRVFKNAKYRTEYIKKALQLTKNSHK
jgi:hypothetical protein